MFVTNRHRCGCWGICHCHDYYCPCCGQRKPQPCNPWRPAPSPWWIETTPWPRYIEPNVGKEYNPTRPRYMC